MARLPRIHGNAAQIQALLRAAYTGDNDARERLYVDYGPYFRRVIDRRLRSQRVEWATTPHDIFDTVMLRVWQEAVMTSLQTEEDFLKYVSRAVKYEIYNLRRTLTARRRDYRRVEALPESVSTLEALDSDPLGWASFNEVMESIRCQLSDQNWQILDMWLAGNAWVTIGESFGEDAEALRKRFHRSLAHIRQQLSARALSAASQ